MLDFGNDHRIATFVGVVVIGLIGLVFSNASAVWELLSSADTRILAACIYGACTLLGILLSTLLSRLLSWLQDRRDRSRVASVLLSEIFAQADMVAVCGTLVNAKIEANQNIFQEDLARLHPPPSSVYSALVDRLVLFPSSAASSVVAFYGAIERARYLTSVLPIEPPPTILSNGMRTHFPGNVPRGSDVTMKRAGESWRAASVNAVRAIKALRPYAKDAQRGDGKTSLDGLIEELAEIGLKNGTPRLSEKSM